MLPIVPCRHTLQKQISVVEKVNEAENLLVLESGQFKRKGDINEPFSMAKLWHQNYLSGCLTGNLLPERIDEDYTHTHTFLKKV